MILSIETSTSICSVALADRGRVLTSETISEPFLHASATTQLIELCLDQGGITLRDLLAIAVSEGPGSFTGLRVGLATAKGLCMALDIPLLSIPTLQALAVGAAETMADRGSKQYCCMLDARRMEVYSAVYNDRFEEVSAPRAVVLSSDFYEECGARSLNTVFVGNGAHKLAQLPEFAGVEVLNLACSAKYMVPLAEKRFRDRDYSRPELAVPKYLKSPNITKARKVI